METFMQTILQISISTAAVIGLLLLLVPVWQQRYSARWSKVIWLVIAIRLLVPFSLELPEAPIVMDVNLEEQTGFTVPVQETARTETRYDTAAVTENQAVTVKPEAQNYAETTMESTVPVMVQKQEPISYGTILFAVWILGLAVFAIWHGVQYVMFGRKVFASALPLEDGDWLRNNAGADMNLHRLPDVLISAEVQSPMLTGFKKPVIVLPERIYGEQELLLILRHELMHYKHHDLWYKLILLAANAMHWFNPFVYLMLRQAGRDVEQVCDDAVTAGQDMAYRKAYSMTILNTMASQKGIALSTCLSKDAQNVKKRFAGILQPKQYKRGAAVFLGIVLLAVAASGCLQIGEKDAGVEAYEQIAEFLPEDAIHNPTVYEVMGEADEEYLMYIWIEGAYEVTAEEAKEARLNDGALSYGRDGKDYLYDRALMLWVSQEDGHIASMGYDNRTMDSAKPSEIGLDKEKRDKYVQRIAKTLINDGENLAFKEQNITSDTDGNAIRGTYTTGTMADIEIYTMRLNYQHGYLEQFMYYGPDAWTQGKVSRQYDITVEGMTETVELTMNRRPDYYVLFADAERFNSQTGGELIEGCFTDKYVLAGDDETTPVKTYMAVSYTPDCTMEEWRQTEKTGKTYAYTLPQIQPGDEWTPGWKRTGQTKIFPEDPYRIWQVLKPAKEIPGISNICYATSYRGGVMAMYIGYPDTYAEGWGSRMHAMADTLVLAAREDESRANAAAEDEGVVLYNKVAPWLPENAVSDPQVYQKNLVPQSERIEYIWDQNWVKMAASSQAYPEPDYPQGLTISVDNKTGEIMSFHYWLDEKQRTLPEATEGFQNTLAPRREYVQRFAETFIENGKTMTVNVNREDTTRQAFIVTDEKNHYEYQVFVSKEYGHIWRFAKTYNNELLKEQAVEWLKEQYCENVSGDSFKLADYVFVEHGERQQMLDDNRYELYLMHNLEWTPIISEQKQKKINGMSDETQAYYQRILDDEGRFVVSQLNHYPILLMVQGNVKWNGKLDMSSLKLYDGDIEITEEYWQQLNDKLEISWTAASYANAWAHKNPERMSLYGVTEGIEFSDEIYHVAQSEFVTQAQLAARSYNGSAGLIAIQIPLPLEENISVMHYLDMALEKQNGEWFVTKAHLKE